MKLFVRHSGKWFWHTQKRKELDNNLLFTNFNNLLFHFSFSMSLFPSPSPSLSRSLYSWSVQWLGMLMNHEKKWSMNKKKLNKTNFEKLFWREREKNHVKVLLIFERLAFKIIFIWFPTGERANTTNEKFFSLKVWSSLVWFTFFLFIFKCDLFFFSIETY